ncbi:peptidoglycan-binding protein [Spirosoma panaciterrae]|uniref:peptidoglycan-binding protein n=1 Tax=Spirosoma panaciterrae TaxID=496058 RepID=UPI00037835F2|nr:peptidoglycan-binding protein [Spirosoma panaciterrae]
MLARTRRPSQIVAPQTQPFFSRNGQGGFFAPMARAFGQSVSGLQTERDTGKHDTRKQQDAGLVIQRLPALEAVGQAEPSDKHDLTSAALAGDPILEQCFDGNLVVKTPHKGDHVTRLQKALIRLGFTLPKHGADSNYGDETTQAVRQFQKAAGMSSSELDGRVGKKTIGLLDRSLRNDGVELDPDKAGDDFKTEDEAQACQDKECKGKPTREKCSDETTKGINKAAGDAITIIDKALKQLPPDEEHVDLFNQIFRFNDPGTVKAKAQKVREIYEAIKAHLGKIQNDPNLYECGTCCDGGCRSRIAYQTGGIIVFCPSVVGDTECKPKNECKPKKDEPPKEKPKKDDPKLVILHEVHHVVVPGSRDKAYNFTRLFTRLDHNEALLNAASFHVYAAWVEDPQNIGERSEQQIGQKIKDTNLVSDPTQKDRVAQALAHLEMWFELIPFDLSQTIVGVEKANQTGRYEGDGPEVRMNFIGWWFNLTRPPRKPTQDDIQKLKAIEERLKKMEDVFGSPFLILPSDASSFWERGPGSGIAVNDELLQLDLNHMITALLQELVHATPTISADREALYVGMINDLRNLRNLAP